MSHIIDRRVNAKNKSTVNRQRFIKRYKAQLKRAVSDAVSRRSITDIDMGEKVSIPSKDVGEPVFQHGQGGESERVHPGNKEFAKGDRVRRPPDTAGGSGKGPASDQPGEGEDDFVFELSRDEYLDLLFDDLELPNMVRNQLVGSTEFKTVRAGITSSGPPANIDIRRSMRQAVARRTAMGAPYRGRIGELEAEIDRLLAEGVAESDARVVELREEVSRLRARIAALPFIDNFDLRFHSFSKKPEPTSKAVMLCIMDISGSMDEERKNLAKRFFILLYLFLQRNYKKIDVVFVRHHTTAQEVDEHNFFFARETGGTVVSSALKLAYEIIADRYDSSVWNIYAAQASDGDNWESDSAVCRDWLNDKLLPLMRYYAYVEITPDKHQGLWYAYQDVMAAHDNFAMERIDGLDSIYRVFRELFKRKEG